ncbi:MAG TPA: glycosyltransferase, partial [Candidatus Saccharibacteria bacterium]|nr:glycosyltransferase [Candidatus Saccharibacteria bacterium]
VTPLLAIASDIKNRYPSSTVYYIGLYKDPMRTVVVSSDYIDARYHILAGKFRRYHGVSPLKQLADIKTNLKNIRDLVFFLIGILQSMALLIIKRPDLLFIKGGFVGLPVGLAAALLKIPIVTHDSDSVPGLTNRILSRYAKLQAVGMPPKLYKGIYNIAKLRYTGVPIQTEYTQAPSKEEAKRHFGFLKSEVIVSVVGGSLGAARLNGYVYKCLPKIVQKNICVLWVAGSNTYNLYKNKLNNQKINTKKYRLFKFVDTKEMVNILSAADVVVSRAGATALAELAVMAKPTIIVPNPYLAGGHQVKNANNLTSSKAALVITEPELEENPALLVDTVARVIEDSKTKRELANNIAKLSVKRASQKIVDVIQEALSK